MREGLLQARLWPKNTGLFLWRHKNHTVAGILIFFWCISYFTTGQRIEWGDFSFFAQAYEAMRVSILHYHQFPWWNPWMSGGIPLYANPQMGVFSIQMLLALIFGAPLGLKIALAIYTALGYASMYLLLRKYFRVETLLATCASLIWIFCSFFVSHLPAHFTFAWYMLAPFFLYLALTIKTWRGGLVLGAVYVVMAQSQIHNPFFHISLLVCVILLCRFIRNKELRKPLLIALAVAATLFVVFAGHRFFMTVQNVHEFPRTELLDPAPSKLADFLGPLVPLSFMHPLTFILLPQPPQAPYGFGEVSATIGVFAITAVIVGLLYFTHQLLIAPGSWKNRLNKQRYLLSILGVALLCLLLAFGKFSRLSPYNVLKHLPVFGQMRVSTRWFIFFDIAILIFVTVLATRASKRSFLKFSIRALLMFGVAELFLLNAGYQARILWHDPIKPPKSSWQYPFVQTSYFGETRKLSDGSTLKDDGNMPHEYREYEATTFNEGILYANDSLVQLALDPRRDPGHPTCPVEEGCNFVRSKNAVLTYWSPNKIVLKRTGKGTIYLNTNNSSYFVINSKRDNKLRVSEPFTDFGIKDPSKTITILVKPSVVSSMAGQL